ncbi:MAG: hypothetical protein K9I85_02395 [Saprospiraceae bacterium]|nr:hypothetical protein [Saprospiraceae bacterium]
MGKALPFTRQSKGTPPSDPFDGVAMGCMIILFLLIVGMVAAFVLISRGNKQSKALEEKIKSLQEKVKEQQVDRPDQRAALQEVYPFPEDDFGIILR